MRGGKTADLQPTKELGARLTCASPSSCLGTSEAAHIRGPPAAPDTSRPPRGRRTAHRAPPEPAWRALDPRAAPCGSQAMARWFCGVPTVWEFFSAPLIPERCYFSATITRAQLESHGVEVYDREEDCQCVPAPPPPASPPEKIYFCGHPAVWHFFDHNISPTTCYYSYSITRIEVMSEGVNVRLRPALCPSLALALPPPSSSVCKPPRSHAKSGWVARGTAEHPNYSWKHQ